MHYCRMLLTRHYDQRPFDETVCDASIANGDVINHQKRCKTFAMNIKHGSDFSCVCDDGHTVDLYELFAMRQNNINGQPDQGVCDIRHTVHSDEPFVMIEVNTNDSA